MFFTPNRLINEFSLNFIIKTRAAGEKRFHRKLFYSKKINFNSMGTSTKSESVAQFQLKASIQSPLLVIADTHTTVFT